MYCQFPPPCSRKHLWNLTVVTRCCHQAKISVWWPGLSQQVEEYVWKCERCANHALQVPKKTVLGRKCTLIFLCLGKIHLGSHYNKDYCETRPWSPDVTTCQGMHSKTNTYTVNCWPRWIHSYLHTHKQEQSQNQTEPDTWWIHEAPGAGAPFTVALWIAHANCISYCQCRAPFIKPSSYVSGS